MGRYAEVSVQGFDALDRQFAQLERGPSDDEVAEALFAGARVIADEERRLVRKRTGNLERSITETMEPTNIPFDGRTIFIGPRIGKGGADGWYGVFEEFGRVGEPAHPFVRPAVDRRGGTAMAVVLAHLARAAMKLAA